MGILTSFVYGVDSSIRMTMTHAKLDGKDDKPTGVLKFQYYYMLSSIALFATSY